jgi:tetratricopeptide (TPR) repeat protein
MKNRYHISIISVLLLYVNTVFAQSDHQMDSLQQVAQQAHAAGNRVEEAKAYLSISKIWDKQEQNQQALENVERALAVLPTGYPTLLGELIHQKSRILFFSGDPASSLTWMDSSYQLLKNCNNLALLNPALMFYGSGTQLLRTI